MQLPFTIDEFFGVFRNYNQAVWPAQMLLIALAGAAMLLAVRPARWSGQAISIILAFFWGWIAVAYHLLFFARINPLAYLFFSISAAGAIAFAWHGLIRRRLHFSCAGGGRAFVGVALLTFALAGYPAWSWYAGHRYPDMPTFGLPCPTTLFTVGLLAFLVAPYPRGIFIVPILWCLIGAQAAFLLGVYQDLALLPAAAAGIVLAIRARGKRGRLGA